MSDKIVQLNEEVINEQRQGYRSGYYSLNLTTISGDVTLKGISFETAIIERYRRRSSY